MKLHLNTETVILSTPPTIKPVIYGNFLIYYASSTIHFCLADTGKIIKKMKFNDVQIIKVHNRFLYICSTDVSIIDLNELDQTTNFTFNCNIVDSYRLSKSLINFIEIFDNKILISKTNKQILLYSTKKKVSEVSVQNFPEGILLNENYYGYYNFETLSIFNIDGLVFEIKEPREISCAILMGDICYVMLAEGTILNISIANKTVSEHNLGFTIRSSFVDEDKAVLTDDDYLYEVDFNGCILNKAKIADMIENYSGRVNILFEESMIKRNKQNYDISYSLSTDNEEISMNSNSEDSIISNEDDSSNNSDEMKQEKNNQNYNISYSINTDNEDDLSNNSDEMKQNYDISYSISTDNEKISTNSNSEVCTILNDDDSSNNADEIYEEMNQDENITKNIQSNEINISEDLGGEEISETEFNSEDISETLNIRRYTLIDKNIIKTSENDIIIFYSSNISKIYSFVDDVIDSVRFMNNQIFITSSGWIKIKDSESFNSENILCSKIIRLSNSPILCAKLYKNVLLLGTKDRTILVYLIHQNRLLSFDLIYKFVNFRSAPTNLDFDGYSLIVSTEDNIVQIYKSVNSSDAVIDFKYFQSFENIMTQALHSKSINHLLLTPKYIISSSSDCTCKILDYNGVLINTIQSDKVLNTCYNLEYIAICSHKAIKVIKYSSLEVHAIFNVQKPVLSSCIYQGYLLAISDVLRVYDIAKKKCVKSYDLNLINCWSFEFPTLCAENKIVFLTDISKSIQEETNLAIKTEIEDEILMDKYIKDKNYSKGLLVLLNKKSKSTEKDFLIKNLILKGYFESQNLDFLIDIVRNGVFKTRIFEILIKNSGFKNSEVLNMLIQTFGFEKIDGVTKGKIEKILSKHCEAINQIYIDFIGLDIFED